MILGQNSYINYPYYQGGNPVSSSYMQPQTPQSMQPQLQTVGLNGKIVESKDILNVTEVPIGGYGVFPKADLSEVYVKTWNPNSKQMDILTYQLTTPEAIVPQEDMSEKILEQMRNLEQKLDNLAAFATSAPRSEVPTDMPVTAKKEVNVHAY